MFIPDPDLEFLPIPDPGSRGQKGTGSRIRNTAFHHALDPDPAESPSFWRFQIHIYFNQM
jgi:hypothetical protein